MTGLARAGKTAFLTSLAANLLAMGAGQPTLPALGARLGGRRLGVALAETGASAVASFDYGTHLDALAADPAAWPERTGAVSLLALDLSVPRAGLAGQLPSRHLRLEFLDYPGEWLLDLPLLRMSFAAWSESVLRRLENQPLARDFLAFSTALPAGAPRDEALAATGTPTLSQPAAPASRRGRAGLSAAWKVPDARAGSGTALDRVFSPARTRRTGRSA